MMNKSVFLKLGVSLSALCWAASASAGVGSDLANFWDRAGGGVNYTKPQSYQGQRAGFATGGSLYIRTKQRNAQLASIQLPSIRAGCGGIDIFGGAFSFISKEELVQLMRGIAQNAAGFAFELALKSMSPAVQDVVAELRDLVERVNSMNINSCEAGQQLVGALWPKIDSASQHICKTIGTHRGNFGDMVASRHGCGAGGNHTSTMTDNGDDISKQIPVDVNYAWKAIKEHPILRNDRSLGELFMTLTGTIITVAAENDNEGPQHRVIPPRVGTPEILKILIEGGSVSILRCDNINKCLNPSPTAKSIPREQALYEKVYDNIKGISEAIDVDGELSAEMIDLLGMSPLPILKTLVTAKGYKYKFVDSDIAIMSQYVAIDLGMQYLTEALETMLEAIGLTTTFGDIGREFQDNIGKTQNNLALMRTGAFDKYEEVIAQLSNLRLAEQRLASKGADKMAGAMSQSNVSFDSEE